jgi:hypothetical protein
MVMDDLELTGRNANALLIAFAVTTGLCFILALASIIMVMLEQDNDMLEPDLPVVGGYTVNGGLELTSGNQVSIVRAFEGTMQVYNDTKIAEVPTTTPVIPHPNAVLLGGTEWLSPGSEDQLLGSSDGMPIWVDRNEQLPSNVFFVNREHYTSQNNAVTDAMFKGPVNTVLTTMKWNSSPTNPLWMAKLFFPYWISNSPKAHEHLGMTLDLSSYLPDGWKLFDDPNASIFVNSTGYVRRTKTKNFHPICGTNISQDEVASNCIKFFMTTLTGNYIDSGDHFQITVTMCLQLERK